MLSYYSVPCPPFNLQLTPWDRRMSLIYSQRVLCFSLSKDTQQNKEYITQMLHTALKATVNKLPFLAGSVVPLSKDQPWLHDLRPSGAAYLEV